MKSGLTGAISLILPENTPNRIGIVQDGTKLAAVSGCCGWYILYNGANWYCTNCLDPIKDAPNSWGSSSEHNLAHVYEPSVAPVVSNTVVSNWIIEWTGLPAQDINVDIQP